MRRRGAITRRGAVGAIAAAVGLPSLPRRLGAFVRVVAPGLAAIERSVIGRLGVAVLDTESGRRMAHRADERFPMCSTFKWLLAGQVLARIDAGVERADRVLAYTERDLLPVSPVTRANVAQGGLPVLDLAAAAVSYSDNCAANLLLAAVGGPPALTRFLRDQGDQVTRLDRMEPDLNEATPGDPRDTTTPGAMLASLHRLLIDTPLTPESHARLIDWLMDTVTGNEKLRAGVPSGWRVGDKTGMGGHGSTNDVAIAWPPGRKPVLIAAYLTDTGAGLPDRNGALAEVARLVADWVIA